MVKVKCLESEVQTLSVQGRRDLLLCFPFQNVLCLETDSLHLQNFLFQSLMCYCVPGLYVRMGCQIYSLRVLSLINSKLPGTFSLLFFIITKVESATTRTYCLI